MKALLVYEDFASAVKAHSAVRNSAMAAGLDDQWEIVPWRMELLSSSESAAEALVQGLDADLLILAGQLSFSVSPLIEKWIRNWAASRHVANAALGYLQPSDTPSNTSLITELSFLAAEYGLSFIVSEENGLRRTARRPPTSGERFKGNKLLVSGARFASRKGFVEKAYRGWQINDY